MKESLNLESRRQPKAGPLYRTLTTRQGTRVTVPRRSRRDQQAFEQANRPYREGRWSKEERLLFLQGLKTFGVGKWKEIGTLVTTRSNIQIKSYSQRIVRRLGRGENVFAELEQLDKNPTTSIAIPSIAAPQYFQSQVSSMMTRKENTAAIPSREALSTISNESRPTSTPSKDETFVAKALCKLRNSGN